MGLDITKQGVVPATPGTGTAVRDVTTQSVTPQSLKPDPTDGVSTKPKLQQPPSPELPPSTAAVIPPAIGATSPEWSPAPRGNAASVMLQARGAQPSPTGSAANNVSAHTPAARNTPVFHAGPDVGVEAQEIQECFSRESRWSALRSLTTPKDLADVRSMVRKINPDHWQELYVNFWESVIQQTQVRPPELVARDQQLPDNWFAQPFYYLSPHYFGNAKGKARASFEDLTRMLDYLEHSGFKNIYILPHYESPQGDGGYDVSAYEPAQSLGGEPAFQEFMAEANRRGFRVVTDAPFNHTSVKHEWFQKLLSGDPHYADYYLRMDGWKVEGVTNDHGNIRVKYRSPDGSTCEHTAIFPDIKTSELEEFTTQKGDKITVQSTFYPFQIDLNLRHPEVLKELLNIVGKELNDGILGKRTDAIAHWMKRAGTASDGLPETHSLQALLKSYMRHVSPRSVILPEAVRWVDETARYAGVATKIAGQPAPSEGDAIFDFPMQGALREMLYFQKPEPFWKLVFKIPLLPVNGTWLNLLEHHDETFLGYTSDKNRWWLGKYIEDHGGQVYKAGMSAGGRYADNLNNNPVRIANALFCLYMAPGTPVVYYGTEIGKRSNHAHAKNQQKEQHQILKGLGVDVPLERAYDPRELQRGPVPAKAFFDAENRHYPGVETVKALNELRATRPTLQSIMLTPIDCGVSGVLAMVKFVDDGTDVPMMALANLTEQEKHLRIPEGQLRNKMRIPDGKDYALVDALGDATGRGQPIPFQRHRDGTVEITLPPYSHLLLDAPLR